MGKKPTQSRRFSMPVMIAVFAVIALGATSFVQAMITTGPSVIDSPAVIADDAPGATNDRQQAFNERQAVTLLEEVRCSNAIIPEGEVVNSHTIFYNTPFSSPDVDAERTWAFDGEVICVMAERSGLLQGITDGMLGAPGTQYPGPFEGRGLETDGTDSYDINGNEITITMTAEEPGDWIRVLTKVNVPDDTTPPVVYCEVGTNPSGKSKDNQGQGKDSVNENFVTLIGADETDGAVDIYLTDTESDIEFGPFAPGDQVHIITSKGARPNQGTGPGAIDYQLKVNGTVVISATDATGNEGTAECNS